MEGVPRLYMIGLPAKRCVDNQKPNFSSALNHVSIVLYTYLILKLRKKILLPILKQVLYVFRNKLKILVAHIYVTFLYNNFSPIKMSAYFIYQSICNIASLCLVKLIMSCLIQYPIQYYEEQLSNLKCRTLFLFDYGYLTIFQIFCNIQQNFVLLLLGYLSLRFTIKNKLKICIVFDNFHDVKIEFDNLEHLFDNV